MKAVKIGIITLMMSLPGLVIGQTEVYFLGHQFGVGAKALGMGGAFTAVADDYTASYWNPAGLAQIHRMELLGAMSHFKLENKAGYQNTSLTDNISATKLNAIGFVIPYPTYRGSLVFSVGYNRIRGFDKGFRVEQFFDAGTDTAYMQKYSELESGSLSNWVFSGAIDVTYNLSLGASINIWRGNDDYEWLDEFDSERNIYEYDYDSELNINTSYSAVNLKLGALYRLGILGRIGATISTPVKLKATEDWRENTHYYDNYDPAYADSNFYDSASGQWDYTYTSPYIFGVGGAFTLLPNLVIAGDVEYSDWTQLKYNTEPAEGSKSEVNRNIRRNYRATTQYHVGAEFTIPFINIQLRGGFFNRPLPYKEATKSMDRKYLTAGVGFLLDKQVKLDVAWLRGWWKDESSLSDRIPQLRENFEIDKFLATLAFRF